MTGIEFLLIAGMATSIVGSVISAKGKRDQGQVEQQAYDYNAEILEGEAETVKEKAFYDEEVYREKVSNLISTQRAAYGASGVVVGEGSPLVVMADTARQGEKEALMIRYGGSVEGTGLLNRAQLQTFYGKAARRAGKIGATTTLLSGLGSAAMNFGIGKTGIK